MAKLIDMHQQYRFEIEPIPPSLEGPHDAYNIRMVDEDHVIYERIYIDQGKQSPHSPMREIAQAFWLSPKLLDTKLNFSIVNTKDPDYFEPVSLKVSIDLFDIVMNAEVNDFLNTINVGDRLDSINFRKNWYEPYIFISIYLRTTSRILHRKQTAYLAFDMACKIDETVRFGRVLAFEMEVARQSRIKLGISAPDDFVEDESGV